MNRIQAEEKAKQEINFNRVKACLSLEKRLVAADRGGGAITLDPGEIRLLKWGLVVASQLGYNNLDDWRFAVAQLTAQNDPPPMSEVTTHEINQPFTD